MTNIDLKSQVYKQGKQYGCVYKKDITTFV